MARALSQPRISNYLWLITALSLFGSAVPSRRPRTDSSAAFEEVSEKLKVSFRHEPSSTSNKYLLETMGGGVALFDYDNDGRLDIFFTNGAKLSDPMPKGAAPDKTDPKYWNRLYHQNADGTFSDVTEHAGVSGQPEAGYSMGVAVGDYDNDGYEDLFVTTYGGGVLYHNSGDGTFRDVTAQAGVRGGGWMASAGFFDYNNDGHLDLFVTRYLDWTFETNIYCGDRVPGHRAYCHPKHFPPVANLLYRNNGNGTFTDVSIESGIAAHKGKSLGVAFADYDNDGNPDVFVANDSSQCFLFHNNGHGGFDEAGLESGAGLNQDGNVFAGMGVDFADYDNDGRPDIVVTDLSNERYVLFHNVGGGLFSDESSSSGLSRITMLLSGWSTKFIDYDNDGWKDLFAAQGHVLDNIEKTSGNLTYEQPPLLARNDGGKFSRLTAGEALARPRAGRGAAFGDLNGDGFVDIVVANVGQRPSVLRNRGGSNHWLGIRLRGTRSNRDGIGAHISVTTPDGNRQSYSVSTTAGYLSASDRRVIVGLGTAATAQSVTIRWPGGTLQELSNIRSNQMLDITEPRR